MYSSNEPILINLYQIESVFSQGKQGCAIRMISGEVYYVSETFEYICEEIDQLK
jgi:hypothetical protein